jgi:hypothetical protein
MLDGRWSGACDNEYPVIKCEMEERKYSHFFEIERRFYDVSNCTLRLVYVLSSLLS